HNVRAWTTFFTLSPCHLITLSGTSMMTETLQLRPAQADILQYDRGRMAVSAVPGSGKTFTLSLLAAQLIASKIDPERQQILIVTYLNASVDTFKARIRKRLNEMGLLP